MVLVVDDSDQRLIDAARTVRGHDRDVLVASITWYRAERPVGRVASHGLHPAAGRAPHWSIRLEPGRPWWPESSLRNWPPVPLRCRA